MMLVKNIKEKCYYKYNGDLKTCYYVISKDNYCFEVIVIYLESEKINKVDWNITSLPYNINIKPLKNKILLNKVKSIVELQIFK